MSDAALTARLLPHGPLVDALDAMRARARAGAVQAPERSGIALPRDGDEEVLGLLVPHRRCTQPAPMCAGADADVVLIAPVNQIVATFLAGSGVIAGFVSGQTGGRS